MRARDSLGKKLCLYSREVLVARRTLLRSVQTASTSTTLPDNPSSSFSPNPSSSSSPSSISPAESSSTQFDYRNLLQSCSRIFADDTPLKSSVWRNRLFKAEQTLKPDKKRKTRIAVVGASQSGTANLIPCLLDEPLSDASSLNIVVEGQEAYDNQATIQALQTRNQKRSSLHHRPSKTSYGLQLHVDENVEEITVPHNWLKERNVEFIEIIDPRASSADLDELYHCDMILFVTDDLTLTAHKRYHESLKLDPTLRLLRYFAHKPATRVLVNHITPSAIFENDTDDCLDGLKTAIGTEAFTKLQRQTTSSTTPANRSIIDTLIHTSLALASKANNSLRLAISQPKKTTVYPEGDQATAWSEFSSLYTASGLVRVKAAIEQIPLYRAFASQGQDLEVSMGANLQTINYLVRQSLDQALYGISEEIEEVRQAQGAASVLREEVEAYKTKTTEEVFLLTRQDDGLSRVHERAGDRSNSRETMLQDSQGFVEKTFASRLPWWKILWKVDDVRAETEAAVDQSFAKNFEQQLIFETGKLLNVAERLQQRTTSVFKLLSPSSSVSYRPLDSLERDHGTFRSAFHSPTLLNELRQYSVDNVEKELRPDLLIRPIEKRRRQLLAMGGPVDVLCLRAQRSVLTSVGIVGSTGLLSLIGALAGGPFGVGLPAMCAPLAMQASTASGLFVFASTFSIWLLQTRWTRAKKRFWRQWERIAYGLDADLKSNLNDVFENIVGAQSIRGAIGLEKLSQRRISQLESLYDTVEVVTSDIKKISSSDHPSEPSGT